MVRAVTLCTANEQSSYILGAGAEWVDIGDESGITLTDQQFAFFSSGEQINAYRTSREYTPTEQDVQDDYYEAQN